MKSSFKYIVIGIIGALSLIFFWQTYWLRGLYQSIREDTEKTVIQSIEDANIDELQFRVDSLDKEPTKENTITVSHSFGRENSDSNDSTAKKTKQYINKEDTVTSVETTNEEEFSLRTMEKLLSALKESMHQALDEVSPINMNVLDSAIVINLAKRGIETELYRTEVVKTDSNKVQMSYSKDSIPMSNYETFDYTYDSENNMAYRIYIEPLTQNILYQMSGILVTTALIVVLLSFAFWYLIKTVMRQKTLEEMKDDFTNNMTHELKTPIAVAYAATDALLNFKLGEDKAKREKYLTICKEQLSELSGLVEQILSMSMEQRKTFLLDKKELLMKDLINSLVDQHRLKTEKTATLRVDIQPEDLSVYADRTHLSNIISNLIDNAIKYSGDDVMIEISATQDAQSCVIKVKDNGTGITSEKLPYIFDKFYRVTAGNQYTTKGYGLGLYYVKTMVEKHGGSISVDSTLAKGSTFTIKIPINK